MKNEQNDQIKAVGIKDLSYFYKSDWAGKRFHALKNITLEVAAGESFGFLGHNGAGKTTAIKCILALIRLGGGSILIFGRDHRDPLARRFVGYLPEQPYFYDYLTVQEIMEMYASLAGVEKNTMYEAIREALNLVHVSAKVKSPMRTLSKGLTQRVAMAQAIVAKPKLLILDEPFSGLDPIGRKEFKELLFHLKQQGTTIFMSSHILTDVEFLCDRASIMAYGELKGIFDLKDVPRLAGSGYELVLRDAETIKERLAKLSSSVSVQDKFITFSFASGEIAEEALRMALDVKATIHSYQYVEGNLEDLFVQLVRFEEAKA